MTSTISYVPILLTKRGELAAVADLPPELRPRIAPMFVVHPVDMNFETDSPSKTVAEHVRGLGRKIADSWGTERAMLDTTFVIDDTDPSGGLRTITDDAANAGLHLVPVVSPHRPEAHTSTAAELHRLYDNGVCIRLSPSQWPNAPQSQAELTDLINVLGVTPESVDLVLDLGDEPNTGLVESFARHALAALPNPARWRTLVLAGAAFPRDLTGVPKGQITRVPRHDWHRYQRLASETASAGHRVPAFGDYAVAHPDPTLAINPRFMSISASLRYTSDDDWLVAKGSELFKGRGGGAGGEAIRPAARMLLDHEEFCGANFSEGDEWISEVARNPQSSCGNPERWRRTATNHHIVFVTDRLAILSAP
jgi:hypothetical protein